MKAAFDNFRINLQTFGWSPSNSSKNPLIQRTRGGGGGLLLFCKDGGDTTAFIASLALCSTQFSCVPNPSGSFHYPLGL